MWATSPTTLNPQTSKPTSPKPDSRSSVWTCRQIPSQAATHRIVSSSCPLPQKPSVRSRSSQARVSWAALSESTCIFPDATAPPPGSNRTTRTRPRHCGHPEVAPGARAAAGSPRAVLPLLHRLLSTAGAVARRRLRAGPSPCSRANAST